jgi:probable H4MPT-linked C1 transfer pathway protein
VGGRVVAIGVTDPDRLATRELVYSGAVRTPTEALASLVAVRGGTAGTSADGFALSGDVHVWLGKLPPEDYTAPTPDGRLATRQSCGDRLARVVCGDRALLSDRDLTRIARSLAAAQVARLVEAIDTVRQRHPSVRLAVVAGLGEFVARSAARAAGLSVVPLSRQWGTAGSRAAAAVSVALLWDAKQHSVR